MRPSSTLVLYNYPNRFPGANTETKPPTLVAWQLVDGPGSPASDRTVAFTALSSNSIPDSNSPNFFLDPRSLTNTQIPKSVYLLRIQVLYIEIL